MAAPQVEAIEPTPRWEDIRLTSQDMLQILNIESCERSSIHKLVCLEVLSELGQYTIPGHAWVIENGCLQRREEVATKSQTVEVANRAKALEQSLADIENQNQNRSNRCERISFLDLVEQELQRLSNDGLLPKSKLMVQAVNRGLRVLDPHASVRLREEVESSSRLSSIQFGIGVEVTSSQRGLLIVDIYKGSSADEQKLKAGDEIIEIHGQMLRGLSNSEISSLFEKDRDGRVPMGVLREDRWLSVDLKRKNFSRTAIETSRINIGQQNFLYIRLRRFSKTVAEGLSQIFQANPDAPVILDLRYNPGGLLSEAQRILELLLPPDSLLIQTKPLHQGWKRFTSDWSTEGLGSAFMNFLGQNVQPIPSQSIQRFSLSNPLVVLVNHGSASAAEGLAAALQDHRRAWLVGEPTFGKGSVQDREQKKLGGAEFLVYRTQELFYRPSGESINLVGVEPDFIVSGIASAELPPTREVDILPRFSPLARTEVKSKLVRTPGYWQMRDCVFQSDFAADNIEPLDRELRMAAKVLWCDSRLNTADSTN